MKAAIKHGAVLAAVMLGLGVIGAGCLTRPVESSEPATKTNVTIKVENQVINKVDLLFDIDNSASMGDKQYFLVLAIPDLVNRLINPNCIDNVTGMVVGASVAGQNCPANSKPEFQAVRDMHIGILSSSLGPRGSEIADPTTGMGVCNPQQAQPPFATLNAHMDDQAHLLGRSLTPIPAPPPVPTEGIVQDAVIAAYTPAPSGFLYWYPQVNGMGINGPPTGPATPIGNVAQLQMDFQQLVAGVGTYGCGIESQMESWYRFLVQPDPYASIDSGGGTNSGAGPATWVGLDSTIIQERHDFLRSDSLVAVVTLSDENDSEIDARSLGAQGFRFMRTTFYPPHGTSPCAANPLAAGCHSCGAGGAADQNDPNCKVPAGQQVVCKDAAGNGVQCYTALNDWGYDPNLRHVHMRAKYGIDPQFPPERYVLGLTSLNVPDRNGEYPATTPPPVNYQGLVAANQKCVNPLFAATLPQASDLSGNLATDAPKLCNLTPGSRTADKIFFAHIGGVPYQLLHFMPGDPVGSTLTGADWVRILGTDPEHYNYNGIDSHMYEFYQPRQGVTGVTFDNSMTSPLAPATGASNVDKVSGREWITDTEATPGSHILHVDRQYACIFPLPMPRDCTMPINNAYSCDCPATPTGLTHEQTPPLCSDANPTSQVAAKAYPTARELLVAKLMGNQGIVASICPQNTTDNTQPNYGYRPAVAAIIDRLKAALSNPCLPHKLCPNVGTGAVPCLILVTLPPKYMGNTGTCLNPQCPANSGLTVPSADVLKTFCDNQENAYLATGGVKNAPGDPALQSVCELPQLPNTGGGTCLNDPNHGWCYVQGAAAMGCSQQIVFSPNSLPSGSVTNLSCIEESVTVVGDAGGCPH